jgi:hypothetical protein
MHQIKQKHRGIANQNLKAAEILPEVNIHV